VVNRRYEIADLAGLGFVEAGTPIQSIRGLATSCVARGTTGRPKIASRRP